MKFQRCYYIPGGVVGPVLGKLGVEVHALHAEGVDAPLHVLHDLGVVHNRDVGLQGDEALPVVRLVLEKK